MTNKCCIVLANKIVNYTQRNTKLEFYSIGKEWKCTLQWNVVEKSEIRDLRNWYFLFTVYIIVRYLFLIVVRY